MKKNKNKKQKNKNFFIDNFSLRNHKAEMTSKQIVTIVLLLMGFVILLIAYSQLGKGDINREVCHQSVVLRGTLPDTFDIKNLPSLKCKTRKVCITNKIFGKGECDEFKGQDYDTIRVSKNKPENEINSFIAKEMEDCWSMMGEGKLQIFTRDVLTKKRCSICSRIAFDKSIKDELEEVKGIGNYLISKNIININENYNPSSDKFSTTQKAIVFFEMDDGSWINWGKALAVGSAGAVIGSIVPVGGTIVGGIVGFVGGATIGWFVDLKGEKTPGEYRSGWNFMDYDATKLQELDCSSFESIS